MSDLSPSEPSRRPSASEPATPESVGFFHPSGRPYRFTILMFISLLVFGSYFAYDSIGALETTLIEESAPGPQHHRQPLHGLLRGGHRHRLLRRHALRQAGSPPGQPPLLHPRLRGRRHRGPGPVPVDALRRTADLRRRLRIADRGPERHHQPLVQGQGDGPGLRHRPDHQPRRDPVQLQHRRTHRPLLRQLPHGPLGSGALLPVLGALQPGLQRHGPPRREGAGAARSRRAATRSSSPTSRSSPRPTGSWSCSA